MINESVPVKKAWYTFINHRESVRVSISRIILVEGDANDTKFRLEEGKERGVARPIKFFEGYLENPRFACGCLGLLGLIRIT